MKIGMKFGLKKIFYSLGANLVTLLGSTLIVLIVPKFIGEIEYGYWQLYLFYISYIGFLQFGWSDGLYLRYGGYYYDKLNRKTIATQFWFLFIFEIFIMIFCFVLFNFLVIPGEKKIIVMFALFLFPIIIPKAFLTYILQATSRIKAYSLVTITESLLYVTITLVLIAFKVTNYQYIIFVDFIAKIISFLVALYLCREVVFKKLDTFKNAIAESLLNIRVGIKLMLANIAGMLILGIMKLAIENFWDIETFGKVSFSISISNMMMVFITAVGIVIFPIIKRIDSDYANSLYITLRDLLMTIMFFALILFFPISHFLSLWLPQYNDSLQFLAVLFPICIFEGKMSLLILTYLKALRKEKNILIINVFSVCLTMVFTSISVYGLNDLFLSVLSIVVVLCIRSVGAEIYLARVLRLNLRKEIISEIIMCILFIVISYNFSYMIGFFFYFPIYCIYFYCRRKEIFESISVLKKI